MLTVAPTNGELTPLKGIYNRFGGAGSISECKILIEDKIKYELETIEEGKKFSLEITTRSGIKESFQGKVVLKTNSRKKPQIDIFVKGKVQSELKVAPQYVFFGIIDTGKEVINPNSLKRTVIVSSARGGGLTIEKIEPSADWIAAEVETPQKEEKYTIIFLLDKKKLPKGQFQETVKIHTKHNKVSESVNVILAGKVL